VKRVRARPLFYGSLAALLGLAIGSLGITNALPVSLTYLILVSFLGFLFFWLTNTTWRWWLVLSVVVALAVLYASLRVATFPIVTQETELKDARAIVVSTVVGAEGSEQFYADLLQDSVRTRVKVTLRAVESFRYGDVILVDGILQPPRDSVTFNESGYLRAHGAHGRLLAMNVRTTDERIGNHALIVFHDIRTWLLRRLHGIAEPERQIVAGIVLGDATAMPARIQDAFRKTGTTHMLVASGANVAILAWMIERILAGFGRRAGLVLTGLVIIVFAVMAGGEASIVRAVVLYLILILAKLSGRRVHAPTILAAVALGMVVWNPWTLLFNASFQLSFAAIVGLMTLSNWFASKMPTWWLKEFLAPTLAAEVATLPILLFSFGQLSLIAPIINLIALPLVMPIMVGGVATLMLPGFRLLVWATEGITMLLLSMVAAGARIPWASATTDSHRLLASGGALILFAILLILRYRAKTELVEADVE
jgi:ComEC/Rec2-related protein